MEINNNYKINNNGCWDWLGEINHGGYGRLTIKKKHYRAHRYFYELHIGNIPIGLDIHHICHNRKCVNPQHLEALTPQENIKRSIGIRIKNHPNCNYGHAYIEENIYYAFNDRGIRHRRCRTCALKIMKRYNERKKLLLKNSI